MDSVHFDGLLEDYLNGSLSEDELESLHAVLTVDSARLDEFASRVRLHQELMVAHVPEGKREELLARCRNLIAADAEQMRAQTAEVIARRLTPTPVEEYRRRSSRRRILGSARRRRLGPKFLASAVATTAIVIMGAGLLLLSVNRGRARHPMHKPRRTSTQTAAASRGESAPQTQAPATPARPRAPVEQAPKPPQSVAHERPSTQPRPSQPGVAIPELPAQESAAAQAPSPQEQRGGPQPRSREQPSELTQETQRAIARVAQLRGTIWYARGDAGRWSKAVEGIALMHGDRIDTRTGMVRIEMAGTGQVLANKHTTVHVRSFVTNERKVALVSLERGEVYVVEDPDLRAQASGRKSSAIHVETSEGMVTPIGTRFDVKRVGTLTQVVVEEGIVQALSAGTRHSVKVTAGQQCRLRRGARPAAPRRTNVKRALAWTLLLRNRALRGLEVLYTFHEGEGDVIRNQAPAGKSLALHIADLKAVDWLPGGGLKVHGNTRIVTRKPAKELATACMRTNEITIEAWIKPATTTSPHNPARIVTLAPNTNVEDFTLGQDFLPGAGGYFSARLRSTAIGEMLHPSMTSPYGAVAIRLTHLVFTREAAGRHRFFINGNESPGKTEVVKQVHAPWRDRFGGDFSNWNTNYPLSVANDMTRRRNWTGELHLVAIYSRALSPFEVRSNFLSGPRTKRLARNR